MPKTNLGTKIQVNTQTQAAKYIFRIFFQHPN